MGGNKRVYNLCGMCGLQDFINQYTNDASMHEIEEVMIDALHSCLVHSEDGNMICLGFCISYCGINYVSTFLSCFGIISKDIHWSVMIMYYKTMVTYNTRFYM